MGAISNMTNIQDMLTEFAGSMRRLTASTLSWVENVKNDKDRLSQVSMYDFFDIWCTLWIISFFCWVGFPYVTDEDHSKVREAINKIMEL